MYLHNNINEYHRLDSLRNYAPVHYWLWDLEKPWYQKHRRLFAGRPENALVSRGPLRHGDTGQRHYLSIRAGTRLHRRPAFRAVLFWSSSGDGGALYYLYPDLQQAECLYS